MTSHRRADRAEAQKRNVHGVSGVRDETARGRVGRGNNDAGRATRQSRGSRASASTPPSDNLSRVVSILTISGMVAVHAKRAVFTALSGVPGVRSAHVELGRAVVDHDANVTADTLRDAVALAGCDVTGVRVERRLPLSE